MKQWFVIGILIVFWYSVDQMLNWSRKEDIRRQTCIKVYVKEIILQLFWLDFFFNAQSVPNQHVSPTTGDYDLNGISIAPQCLIYDGML